MPKPLSDDERRIRAITEAQWQSQVVEYAQLRGWLVAHFRTAQTARGAYVTPVAADGAGFPDLVLVRDGRLIFAELKRQTGRTTTQQDIWLKALQTCEYDDWQSLMAVKVVVWRPSDWPAVERALS